MIWRWIGRICDPRGECGGERGHRVLNLDDFATRAEVCGGGVEEGEEWEEEKVGTKQLHDEGRK